MTFQINDGDNSVIVQGKGTGNAEIDYIVFERQGEVVGRLRATLHFSELEPELHGLALGCLRSTRLIIGPTEGPNPKPPPESTAPHPRAPWWKFWA